jgi:hypothetical protein
MPPEVNVRSEHCELTAVLKGVYEKLAYSSGL